MEELLLLKVTMAIIGCAVPFMFKQLIEYKKDQKNSEYRREQEYAQMKHALQCLSRDRLIQAHDYYMNQGWIHVHAMSALWALYESYESLGENGVITGLMEQLKDLPNIKPNK